MNLDYHLTKDYLNLLRIISHSVSQIIILGSTTHLVFGNRMSFLLGGSSIMISRGSSYLNDMDAKMNLDDKDNRLSHRGS